MTTARTHRATRLVAVLAIAVLAAGCGILPFSGDIRESGRAGLTVNAKGNHILLLKVCDVPIKDVTIFHSGPGNPDPNDTDNHRVGIWEPRRTLHSGMHQLNLANPGNQWKKHPARALDTPGRNYVAGGSDNYNGDTSSVFASADRLAALKPNEVIVGPNLDRLDQTITRNQFNKLGC